MSSQTPADCPASAEADLISLVGYVEAKLSTLSDSAEDREKGVLIKFMLNQVRSAMSPEAIEQKVFSANLAAALKVLDWDLVGALVANPGNVTHLSLVVTDATLPIFLLLQPASFTTVNLKCDFKNPIYFRAVAHWIRDSPHLRTLHFDTSDLGCEGAEIISEVLADARLKVLTLNQNQIGDKGGEALAGALARNTNLTFLNLVGNKMGPTAGKAFGLMLCVNTTLKELILSDNPLGDLGLSNMMAGLHFNATLRMLGLMGIGATDFGPITSMLGSNDTLRSLYLNQNQFQSNEADALIDAVMQNTSIECLDLNRVVGIKYRDTQEQINTLCFRNKVSHDFQSDPECLVQTQNAINI